MTNIQEVWQVEVNGQVYEATFEELTQWIAENSLLPQDKVRRGNLRWLEAGKIPSLYGFFNAKELGIAPPVLTTTNVAETAVSTPAQTENVAPAPVVTQSASNQSFSEPKTANLTPTPQTTAANFTPPQETKAEKFAQPQNSFTSNYQSFGKVPQSNSCSIHPSEEPKFICEDCRNLFCKTCPKSYGGSVKVCPTCGAMCKPLDEFQTKQQKNFQYNSDLSRGFGFEDFGKAFAYPFKFKFSLVSGAVLFMVFSLAQSASGIGGMVMAIGAIFSTMLANALTFGCLANTVDNMSQGRLNENFMPSFDDFSLWEDVIHPFFLSIGAYVSSFGLFFILVLGMVWYTFSTVSTHQANTINQMSQQMKDAQQHARMPQNGETLLPDENIAAQQQRQALQNQDMNEIQDLIQENRKSQLESVVGKAPETQQQENVAMMMSLLKVGIPFMILGFLAFLWGLFYFPAACAIAGYTRSFRATMNPLVGIDTIKRMGFDYVKVLFMSFLLVVVSGVISLIITLVFAPFDLPHIGNLPAKAIGSFFTFYFSVVFSVILGYALYKNSTKLKLYR